MHELELWLVVDADGDYAVGKDAEEACQSYRENVTNDLPDGAMRQVCVKLMVPLPKPMVVRGEVPVEHEGGTVAVVEA